jgi:ABC-type lipopolysaccharide export system ATPase subunit
VDRAYIIYEGRIFTEGDANSLIENKLVREIYLGEKITKFKIE